MVGGGLSIEGCPPVSHKSASRLVFKKKGTSAESRNPFEYCHGAEGGTRTPTGFPTTPGRPLLSFGTSRIYYGFLVNSTLKMLCTDPSRFNSSPTNLRIV